jgi:hypothetical protein
VVRDERGRTPLMDALMHGNDKATKELVELGADVNAYDEQVRPWLAAGPVPLNAGLASHALWSSGKHRAQVRLRLA